MKIVASVALVILGLLNPALAAPQKMDLETVNKAEWSAKGDKGKEIDPALVKTQVLLDWAHFSPGVIDGHNGENLRNAIKAFRNERGLNPDGALDGEVWDKLNEESSDPVLVEYTIRDEDVKGPFVTIPDKLEEKADLDRLGYSSPEELLAERFHMDVDLLKALNPGKAFDKSGTSIVVANVEAKPASEKPAPSGSHKVRAVAPNPNYTYNPDYAFKGVKAKEKFEIKPGPNNPVGSTWIDLSIESFGIHGTPDPEKVGKAYSQGCVRLTNWDVEELSKMVEKGTPVEFID